MPNIEKKYFLIIDNNVMKTFQNHIDISQYQELSVWYAEFQLCHKYPPFFTDTDLCDSLTGSIQHGDLGNFVLTGGHKVIVFWGWSLKNEEFIINYSLAGAHH